MFRRGDLVTVNRHYWIKGIPWAITCGTEGWLGNVILTKNKERVWELYVGIHKFPVAERNLSLKYSRETMDAMTADAERLGLY